MRLRIASLISNVQFRGQCAYCMDRMSGDVGYLTARVGPPDERAICADERLAATLGRINVKVCISMKRI